MLKPYLATLVAACLALAAQAAGQTPADHLYNLQPDTPDALWVTQNSRIEAGEGVYRWHLQAGQTAELAIAQGHPLLNRLRYYDYATFEVRIAAGELSSMGFTMLGHVSGPRQYKVHEWQVAILTTAKDAWHRRCFELARPNWLPWDNVDGQGVDAFLKFSAVALAPDTVVELRGLNLTPAIIRLKPDFLEPITWPILSRDDAGNAIYTLRHHLHNQANQPVDMIATVVSKHEHFTVELDKPRVDNVKNGKSAIFTLTATMLAADEQELPELYDEALTIVFHPAHAPEASITWQGSLVRPLSPAVRRQILLKPDELTFLRENLSGDEALSSLVKPNAAITGAEEFLQKELLRIPTGHLHVSNNWVGDWRPSDRMPEAVNLKSGEKQFDTTIAARTWKEYMAMRGNALEHLTNAYLFTGDEKYARKAVELFQLYAQQYSSLSWDDIFSPPHSRGEALLSSSRVALSSTYGTNWYFKGHCRLLSAIADSPSLTPEVRQHIYLNFVLPYATELMKFAGGISNMTDITNHNILLLGLAFHDAAMLRWALYSDAGLLRRLNDITPDGFTSEGRPLNYHHAAMSEYLPALAFLDNSQIAVDFPKERLLAAIRMPYQRATLDGFIPNTGDIGRGFRVGKRTEADWLVGMFPDETWLFDLGNLSTIQAQLAAHRTGRRPEAQAWQQLVESRPRLFEYAGYAILRSGQTSAEQIMTTLDFGRNPMHAHQDRNTISLSAFGHLYTQGPGSLYNVGRGGMTRNEHLDGLVSSGSMSQNVVLVDHRDQMAAVGNLLAWRDDPEMQLVAAIVPAIRPGVDHTRAVVLKDGIVILFDKLDSSEDHTYDFVYHNYGDLSLGDGWQATPVTEPLGTTANYERLLEPKLLTGSGPLHLQWTVAENAKLALWATPGGEAFTAGSALNNIQTRIIPQPTPTLIHRRQGAIVHYVTILEPYREQARVQGITAMGDSGVSIHLHDGASFDLDLQNLVKPQ